MKNGENDKQSAAGKPECFVIMPIGDKPGYPPNHFERVFLDIFVAACEKAGFKAVHAGQVKEANLIHLDVLQRLLNAPMVLCDLSTHNPNVLFELGIRQAFDKPVVLVQEAGTGKIFDIAPLRVETYRKERIFNEVVEDQERIAQAILETRNSRKESINSIVRLLSLGGPAKIPEAPEYTENPAFQLVRAEISALRDELRASRRSEDSKEYREDLARWSGFTEAASESRLAPPGTNRYVWLKRRLERMRRSVTNAENIEQLELLGEEMEELKREINASGPALRREAFEELILKAQEVLTIIGARSAFLKPSSF